MADNLSDLELILANHDKKRWIARNRGVFVEVARQLSDKKRVSRQFVSEVYWGRRKSQRVFLALARLRAPGFEKGAR